MSNIKPVIWLPYESKPIVRYAIQIKNYLPFKCIDADSEYVYQNIRFKAYEAPKINDWIVRLTEEDTYHVSDKVFRERNIVPGEEHGY